MLDTDDMALLREFARNNSETAFAALVQRHLNLVYSVALRCTASPGDAQDVAQAVFIILARKAARLNDRTVLTGWLYETTRLTAAGWLRTQKRRQAREQEAYMQSTLDQADTDNLWRQLAPHLEAAMSRLNAGERTLLALRFYENKTGAEAAALLGIGAEAAHKRTARALEKLRKIFTKRGISSTTAILAVAISANAVQAAPVGLAKTISVVAVAKGAAASASTLTIIKGALKIMAWTNAKTAIVVGAGILLAAGTTTITVKEIQEHRTYPWQGQEGIITMEQLNQPPQVRILASKFHIPDESTGDKLLGTGVRAQDVVAAAYGFLTPARAILPAKLPTTRYDFIACLPGGADANKKALQAEVKRKFGVVGRAETRETDVWLLKVKHPNAPGLRLNKKDGDRGNGFFPDGKTGRFQGWNEPMSGVAASLEYWANTPIVDETGLTNRFDFDLNCQQADVENKNWDTVNQALDQLGLELVSGRESIEMLVVEKVK